MPIKKPESGENPPKKKKVEKNPTIRQQKVIKITQEQMVENGGKIIKGKILEESGYPPSTQKNPEKVFGSGSMKKALKQAGLDLKSLKMKHKQLLNSTIISTLDAKISINPDDFISTVVKNSPGCTYLNHFDIPISGIRSYVFLFPDKITQTRALDMAYKILGEYAPEKHEHAGKNGESLIPILYLPDNKRKAGEKE